MRSSSCANATENSEKNNSYTRSLSMRGQSVTFFSWKLIRCFREDEQCHCTACTTSRSNKTHLCTFSFATDERCCRDQLDGVSEGCFGSYSRQNGQCIIRHLAVLLLAPYLQDFFKIFLLIRTSRYDDHPIEKIDWYAMGTFVIRSSDSRDS